MQSGGHHVQSEAIIETVFEHHVQPLRALEARNQLDAKGVVDLGHYLLLSEDMVLLMIGHHLRLRDHLHGEDAARGAIFDELHLRPSRVHQEVIKGSSRGSSGVIHGSSMGHQWVIRGSSGASHLAKSTHARVSLQSSMGHQGVIRGSSHLAKSTHA